MVLFNLNVGMDIKINSSHRSLPTTAEQKTLVYYEQSIKKLSDEKQHWWGQAHKAMKANEHHGQWGIQLKERYHSLEHDRSLSKSP